MTAKARIFTVLQFRPTEDAATISNHVHYVAATCDEEAEDAFREEADPLCSVSHYYVTTDACMRQADDAGSKTRTRMYAENCAAPTMTQGEYARWILAFTSRRWNSEIEAYEGPTYRRIN